MLSFQNERYPWEGRHACEPNLDTEPSRMSTVPEPDKDARTSEIVVDPQSTVLESSERSTHLFVLEAEEEDLLHDRQSWRPPTEARILVFTLQVPRVVRNLAPAFKRRASM